MITSYLLRLHRWITLLFAVPLAVLIVTGLILSFDPILADRGVTGKSISLAQIEQVLAKHDSEKKATSLNVRAFENLVVLAEGRGAGKRIDITTNTVMPADKRLWSDILTTAKRLHETFQLELGWLVAWSTIAMLISMIFGLFMGWPHFRNTLGGWHRGTAWVLAPLLLLSPLTGLALAYKFTFTPPPAKIDGSPVPLHDAVKIFGAKHDFASVIWLRPQGGATRVRFYDGRAARVMAISKAGLIEGPQAWPRVLHEGTWAGAFSGLLNVIVSLAMLGLMSTGLLIWGRRTWRRYARRAQRHVDTRVEAG
jgi:uncharacterized iron-regulated membrane protein